MDAIEVTSEGTGLAWHALGHGGLNLRIRGEILRVLTEQHLMPGDRLPSERELAVVLRVSRPSVREAVRSLQAEGYLIVKHGQGVFVAEPESRKQMRAAMAELDHNLAELYAMREILEVPAARWAAERKNETSLAAIQAAFDRLESALGKYPLNYEELQQLDAAFHRRIVQASGNRLLEQTLNVLQGLLETGMRTTLEVPGRLEQSRLDHQRILSALLVGDANAAAGAAKDHVRGAQEAANRRLAMGEDAP